MISSPGKPNFDPSRCSICGACLQVCPEEVFSMGSVYPEMLHPERCTLCGACEESCPTGAIQLPWIIGWDPNREN